MWGKPMGETVTCSLVSRRRVLLGKIAYQKIELLMKKYKSTEWCGYLTGIIDVDDTIYADDLVIPPHLYALPAYCEPVICHEPVNCVGYIHSHCNMGAFHSHTDLEYVDRNYPVSIVVANKNGLDFMAVSYRKTECGRYTFQDVPVEFDEAVFFDEDTFMWEADECIRLGYKKVVTSSKEV